jgi:N-acetylglucosaminyldiphosphoundecaprenol N-acetyl-beta-D-mannosaminyltransferase
VSTVSVPAAGAGVDRGKRNVLGVLVDAVDYTAAVERIVEAAQARRSYPVTALAVHGVMTAVGDPALRRAINGFGLVAPDGQPVRWALNRLHGVGLTDRVYGPDLTVLVAAAAAREDLPIFLYGSTAEVLERFTESLRAEAPGLVVAGAQPSRFRSGRPEEAAEVAEVIRASGARLALVGLGCPRQEIFASLVGQHLDMPLLAVGAAFDYHAGTLRKPPAGMQRLGLEWLWRLLLEPRRLWQRYLLLNPAYLLRWMGQTTGAWKPRPQVPAEHRLTQLPL